MKSNDNKYGTIKYETFRRKNNIRKKLAQKGNGLLNLKKLPTHKLAKLLKSR